jgi:hypothetical protein
MARCTRYNITLVFTDRHDNWNIVENGVHYLIFTSASGVILQIENKAYTMGMSTKRKYHIL